MNFLFSKLKNVLDVYIYIFYADLEKNTQITLSGTVSTKTENFSVVRKLKN